jgi:hypothetical protein
MRRRFGSRPSRPQSFAGRRVGAADDDQAKYQQRPYSMFGEYTCCRQWLWCPACNQALAF